MIDSVSMHGTVVIGEGEKDEAPMLFNGEEVGNGDGPGRRRRGRPHRRHAAHRAGPAQRARRHRPRGARHHVLPRRGRLHGEDRLRPRGRRRDRHHGPTRGERAPRSRRPRVWGPRRSASRSWTGRVTQAIIAAVRSVGARVFLITDGDVAGAIAAAAPRHGRRSAVRDRRDAGGRHRGRGAQVPGRRHPGAARAARRRRAPRPGRRRLRPGPGAHDRGPRARPTTCSSPPRASPTARCCAACATGPTAPRRIPW